MEHNGGLSAELVTACEQVAEDVISWRHHLHQYPELSNREEKTAAFIADKLEEFGVDSITTDVSGHGVVAIIRGGADGDGESDAPRRSVLLRADIDALPVKEDTDLEFRSEEVDKDYPEAPSQWRTPAGMMPTPRCCWARRASWRMPARTCRETWCWCSSRQKRARPSMKKAARQR